MSDQKIDLGKGITPSVLIAAATRLVIVGTASIKAGKVSALAAVMVGAPSEDVSKRTGVPEATVKRIAAIARGPKASKVSEGLRLIDWSALTATGDDVDAAAAYDATIAAANLWDEFLQDTAKSKPKADMTPTDLAILIHDTVKTADNPGAWIGAVADALKSVARTNVVLHAAVDDALATLSASIETIDSYEDEAEAVDAA